MLGEMKQFLNLPISMKKKLNKRTYNLVLRGRHSDRRKLYEEIGKKYTRYAQNDVPIKHAETIGVYIRRK